MLANGGLSVLYGLILILSIWRDRKLRRTKSEEKTMASKMFKSMNEEPESEPDVVIKRYAHNDEAAAPPVDVEDRFEIDDNTKQSKV